jgi:hypothetical protein
MVGQSEDRRARQSWHIGKEIPIAFVIVTLAQAIGLAWWFGNRTTQFELKLDSAIEQLKEFKVDRYTKDDGRRDQQLMMQMLESLRQSDRELERRVLNCEQMAHIPPPGSTPYTNGNRR